MGVVIVPFDRHRRLHSGASPVARPFLPGGRSPFIGKISYGLYLWHGLFVIWWHLPWTVAVPLF